MLGSRAFVVTPSIIRARRCRTARGIIFARLPTTVDDASRRGEWEREQERGAFNRFDRKPRARKHDRPMRSGGQKIGRRRANVICLRGTCGVLFGPRRELTTRAVIVVFRFVSGLPSHMIRDFHHRPTVCRVHRGSAVRRQIYLGRRIPF